MQMIDVYSECIFGEWWVYIYGVYIYTHTQGISLIVGNECVWTIHTDDEKFGQILQKNSIRREEYLFLFTFWTTKSAWNV